jgi:hypothetical protein
VVPGSPATQGTPVEEQQQQDHNVNNEDEDNEEYSPLSDTDAEEMESFRVEAPVPIDRLYWNT